MPSAGCWAAADNRTAVSDAAAANTNASERDVRIDTQIFAGILILDTDGGRRGRAPQQQNRQVVGKSRVAGVVFHGAHDGGANGGNRGRAVRAQRGLEAR